MNGILQSLKSSLSWQGAALDTRFVTIAATSTFSCNHLTVTMLSIIIDFFKLRKLFFTYLNDLQPTISLAAFHDNKRYQAGNGQCHEKACEGNRKKMQATADEQIWENAVWCADSLGTAAQDMHT